MARSNNEEIERIIRQHANMIYRIAVHNTCCAADAEDIMQDVCIELLTKCPCIDDPQHLKAWLIRVTINKCKSLYRLSQRRKYEPLDGSWPAEPEKNGIMEEIRQLPENMRNAIYLYYYEGYTIAETAGILGKSPNTVSSTLQRARRKLRGLLEEGEDIDA